MTGIPYCDETWPVTAGCTKCSLGCLNCWAEKWAYRLKMMGKSKYMNVVDTYRGEHLWTNKVICDESILNQPLHWRKPRRIFVNSMSDLFHPKVPFEFVLKIFGISMVTPWHTYLIFTKRINRALLFFEWWREKWRKSHILWGMQALALEAVENLPTELNKANKYWLDNFDQSGRGKLDYPVPWPHPNIQLILSLSTQAEADEKIPILLQIPAAVRGLSLEPMLEGIKLHNWWIYDKSCYIAGKNKEVDFKDKIGWVIVGCESLDQKAGRFQDGFIEAARSLVGQCQAANVPVYVKQIPINGKVSRNLKEWPKDLRVQRYP